MTGPSGPQADGADRAAVTSGPSGPTYVRMQGQCRAGARFQDVTTGPELRVWRETSARWTRQYAANFFGVSLRQLIRYEIGDSPIPQMMTTVIAFRELLGMQAKD